MNIKTQAQRNKAVAVRELKRIAAEERADKKEAKDFERLDRILQTQDEKKRAMMKKIKRKQ